MVFAHSWYHQIKRRLSQSGTGRTRNKIREWRKRLRAASQDRVVGAKSGASGLGSGGIAVGGSIGGPIESSGLCYWPWAEGLVNLVAEAVGGTGSARTGGG